MQAFIIFLTILHVLVCLMLIAVVLLQTGKGADLAGAFGGAGSQAALGPRSAANLLSRATTGAAVIFMLTSLGLALTWSQRSGGGNYPEPAAAATEAAAPAAPTPAVPLAVPATDADSEPAEDSEN